MGELAKKQTNVNLWHDLALKIAYELVQKYDVNKKLRQGCKNGRKLDEELEEIIRNFVNERIVMCYFTVGENGTPMEHEHQVNETKKRSMIKGVTAKAMEITFDFVVLGTLGMNPFESIGIAILLEFVCYCLGFVNERIWNKISWGRRVINVLEKVTQSLNKTDSKNNEDVIENGKTENAS